MRTKLSILVIAIFIMAGFGGCRPSKNRNDGLIKVDVTKHYPKKELILQDFMDVEYIPLETNDEFLCQDLVRAIGKNLVVVRNRTNEGDIFIFDRKTGKGLKKINRKGQGGEEYIAYNQMALDEEKGELFVNTASPGNIRVYDLDGNYKRGFNPPEGMGFVSVYNFDSENLICNDYFFNGNSSVIISKQDGSVTKEIIIPFEKKLDIDVVFDMNNNTYTITSGTCHPIIPYFDSWILTEQSSDTIFRYFPDHSMEPFMVRTPVVQSMEPEEYLFLNMLTDRYYFMEAVKRVFDADIYSGFPAKHLVYDKEEKAIFEYTLYNDDYTDKKDIEIRFDPPVSGEIASRIIIEAADLVKDYQKGRLKGRLKEIAATLDDDSNPVVMLIKHKAN